MSQSTFRPGDFTHSVLFNLGETVQAAIRSGVQALILHYGDTRFNHLQLIEVMHAFRRSVGRGGHMQFDATVRQLLVHQSSIAQSFFDGIQHVLARFGDTTVNHYAIIQVFRLLEGESVKQHDLNLIPFDWDKDDDPEGPPPKPAKIAPGTSWGDADNTKLPNWLYPGV